MQAVGERELAVRDAQSRPGGGRALLTLQRCVAGQEQQRDHWNSDTFPHAVQFTREPGGDGPAHYSMEADVLLLRRMVLLLVLASLPVGAEAQPGSDPAWDITGTTSLLAGHTPVPDGVGYQEDWFHVAQGGILVGRHLTRRLKIEFEAAGTNGGTQFKQRLIMIPGTPIPYPVSSEDTTSVRSLAGAVIWQFRDNEWVHPFLQAGVSADFDRITSRTWEPFDSINPLTRVPQLRVEEATYRRVRAVLGGGAKIYVSERTFVRTDGRFIVGRDRQHIAGRIGFGVDF